MKELEKIKTQFSESARQLHKELNVSKRFSSWFEYQVSKFQLTEGITHCTSMYTAGNGREYVDYLLTKPASFRIGNHSEVRSENASTVKDYSTLTALAAQGNEEAILLQAQQILASRIERLTLINQAQTKQLEAAKPKLDYVEKVLDSNTYHNITNIAKELGLRSGSQLNNILHEKRIQYKHNGVWVLYAKHADKGYTITKTHLIEKEGEMYTSLSTKWTEKGRRFIHEVCNVKLIESNTTLSLYQ